MIGRVLAAVMALLCVSGHARAQASDNVIRIGLLTDFSSIYSAATGRGSNEAVRLAIEEFGGNISGAQIELVIGDCQLKPDIAAGIAKRWLDVEKVDMIVGGCNSAAGLAIQQAARDRDVVVLLSEVGVPDVTGRLCTKNTMQWTFDTYLLANAVVQGLSAKNERWYFITADYSFGHALQKDAELAIGRNSGIFVGSARHPLNNPDFSSFLLQAQSSGASVIGLANAAADLSNSIKQASEYQITSKAQLAGFLVLITDIHALGLEITQGLVSPTSFYWDRDEQTREWSRKLFDRAGHMPSMMQAGVYSATRSYLKAVQASGTDNPERVIKELRSKPINDMMVREGRIREDGRLIYDQLLVQVKKPSESRGPWDYQRVVKMLPAGTVYRPLGETECPLAKLSQK